MGFKATYENSIKTVKKDFLHLENLVFDYLETDKNELTEELKAYLSVKSKRIRSALVFLFSRLLYNEVNESSLKLAAAVELVHNATLIHDDIIDDAEFRRGMITLHKKYDEKLSIIAGDYLLSMAIRLLQDTNEPKTLSNFSDALINLCKGEISQYFNKFNVPNIENYIKKSKNKTASLFISALTSLADINSDEKNKKLLEEFATNFGIAFQIHDDLQNISDEQGQKPIFKDIENGIYTAPIIFALENNNSAKKLSPQEIIELAQSESSILKTKELLKNYIAKSITTMEELNDCEYKKSIVEICNLLIR